MRNTVSPGLLCIAGWCVHCRSMCYIQILGFFFIFSFLQPTVWVHHRHTPSNPALLHRLINGLEEHAHPEQGEAPREHGNRAADVDFLDLVPHLPGRPGDLAVEEAFELGPVKTFQQGSRREAVT